MIVLVVERIHFNGLTLAHWPWIAQGQLQVHIAMLDGDDE